MFKEYDIQNLLIKDFDFNSCKKAIDFLLIDENYSEVLFKTSERNKIVKQKVESMFQIIKDSLNKN